MYVTPAQHVINTFKGVRAAARIIGCGPMTVSRWCFPKEKKGGEGRVGSAFQKTILLKARALGLDLTAEDLILGREISEE